MIIIVNVLCPAVHRGRRGGNQNLSISSSYNKSFPLCHHFPIQKNTFTNLLHQCHLLPSHLFPTAMPPYSPCTLFHIPPASTRRSLSNYPHVTIKCSASSPAPLSHITHLSSIIILHLFLSSNNTAEPVLSLNSNLTTF